jgi:peptide-methionine (S)-S-oxide reductase
VVRTRVGYTGGTRADPTYRALGDHTEALQVDFDPSRLSYAEVLGHFWAAHRPQRPAYAQQYRAALWYAPEQEAVARRTRDEVERSLGKQVLTALEPLGRFYPAEDYHQKYALRRHADLLEELAGYSEEALRESTVAARLNGFVSGQGTAELLAREWEGYGLTDGARRKLEALLRGHERLSV